MRMIQSDLEAVSERTGYLITLLAHKEFDDKIKPQGWIKEGSCSIPVEANRQHDLDFIDLKGPTDVIDEEESALAEERLQLVDENEESLLMMASFLHIMMRLKGQLQLRNREKLMKELGMQTLRRFITLYYLIILEVIKRMLKVHKVKKFMST